MEGRPVSDGPAVLKRQTLTSRTGALSVTQQNTLGQLGCIVVQAQVL